jgi:glycosyltransferase involved in cell wall biosynthesis
VSPRPLRVAIDVGPLHAPRTGVGMATSGIVDALTALDGGPVVVPYLVSWRTRPDVSVRRLPWPAALSSRTWAHSSWPSADRFLGDVDVVHGTNYVVPPSRHARVVSVYDCWFLRNPEHVVPDVRRAGAALRRAVADGAAVHVASSCVADEVADLLAPRHTAVVPLGPPPLVPPPLGRGVDPADPPIPELAGRRYVLALGTLERRKNLARLVTAFGAAAARDPELRLVLAGAPGDAMEEIDEAIEALPRRLTETVVLTGRIDESTKSWLLANATVLAYPSLDEGFGFPLLEAMAAGTPIVASPSGSIPEVAGDAALFADPEDVDALASALSAVLDDAALAADLRRRGEVRLTAFDWETTARGLTDLYARVAMETASK